MMTEFGSKQTFLDELRKKFPNAAQKFAHALKMFGNSNPTMDRLKTNAHLLSVMADLSVNANVKTNDDETEDGIHRSLAMFVRKTETGAGGEKVVKFHFAEDDVFFQRKLKKKVTMRFGNGQKDAQIGWIGIVTVTTPPSCTPKFG